MPTEANAYTCRFRGRVLYMVNYLQKHTLTSIVALLFRVYITDRARLSALGSYDFFRVFNSQRIVIYLTQNLRRLLHTFFVYTSFRFLHPKKGW